MTRTRLFFLLIFCLLATVPWFFTQSQPAQMGGFPRWAFYSFCLTVLYPVVVAIFLHRYWSLSAGEDEEDER